MKSRTSSLVIVLLLAPTIDARVWTDISGEHQFTADLVSVSDDLVTLLFVGNNGVEYKFPFAAVSEADQAFVVASNPELWKRKLTFADVPEDLLDSMRQEAMEKWPDDHELQASKIMDAAKKYLRSQLKRQDPNSPTKPVPKAVIESLEQDARYYWPESPRQQAEEVRQQLGYYRILRKYQPTGINPLVVAQAKYEATRIAPNDYRAQLKHVREQVQAGKVYLAALEQRLRSRDVQSRVAYAERPEPKSEPESAKQQTDTVETESDQLETAKSQVAKASANVIPMNNQQGACGSCSHQVSRVSHSRSRRMGQRHRRFSSSPWLPPHMGQYSRWEMTHPR